jgi:hypothetical protein
VTHLFSVGVEGYRFFVVTLDLWMIGGIVAVIALIARFVLPKCKALPFRNVKVDEVKLGFQLPSVTIRVDRREQELAYALWVELGTRKAALPFDEEHDVIVEVYDSWYAFFGMARKLMRDMPPDLSKGSDSLAAVTGHILNDGMRPHLTRWQAEFRRWYKREIAEPKNAERSPQEVQRGFPGYDELVADLKRTNGILMRYRETLREIAGMD